MNNSKSNSVEQVQLSGKTTQITVAGFSTISSPLPPADEFEHYGKVLPDAPERLLKMAEKNMTYNHQESMELIGLDKAFVDNQLKLQMKGLNYMLLIVFVAFIGGIVLVLFDKSLEGAALLIVSVGAVLKYFSPFLDMTKK